MKAAMRRHFPVEDFSIFVTGHSTGGPFVFMISQRVPNIQGILAAENSTFGCIDAKKHDWSGSRGKIEGFDRIATTPVPFTDPFTDLYIRSWRDCARYAGPEALGREGPAALMRLPSLMEEVLERWDRERMWPQFKAEYIVTHNIVVSLEAAARACAKRLGLTAEATAQLVGHYLGLARPLPGPAVKPVPNVVFAIARDSLDHSPEVYQEVVLPLLRQAAPGTRVCVTRFEAGTHFYDCPEDGLPLGIGPNVASLFSEAIANGYFCGADASTTPEGRRMPMARTRIALLVAGILAATQLSPASAQPAAQSFQKTPLRLIVSTAAGGGYDSMGRLVARYMSKYLPGNPVISVQNMPGAGGVLAVNYLANVAPRDGSIFALLDRGVMTARILYGDSSKTQFNPRKLMWLGSVTREAGVGLFSTRSGLKTLDDAKSGKQCSAQPVSRRILPCTDASPQCAVRHAVQDDSGLLGRDGL